MIGAVVRRCGGCGGLGAHWPDNRTCAYCAGDGEVVVCQECRHEMPLTEAQEHGAVCATCRKRLDIPEDFEAAS